MKFQVKDGLNKISIRLSEIGNYFQFEKPLATVWWDCHGSSGQYLCLLPYDAAYRMEVSSKILENLYWDFTDKESDLYEILKPLFTLFPNGTYDLNYHREMLNPFEQPGWKDDPSSDEENQWYLVFAEPQQLQMQSKIVHQYEAMVAERTAQGLRAWDIVDVTAQGFYHPYKKSFVATQSRLAINEDRVKYFETQIQAGKRPFVLVFNAYIQNIILNKDKNRTDHSDHSLYSADYILDGHHKMLAYFNLKLKPPIVEVTHHLHTRAEGEFDIEALIEVLYPWQIKHILKNWAEKEKHILFYLKNPNSKIHQFIKNGH